jgi:hypothetical protein
MPPQEEESKMSPADDERDYSSIPFTLSDEDAVEDDHNQPEPALLQQSEEESNHRNKSASKKTQILPSYVRRNYLYLYCIHSELSNLSIVRNQTQRTAEHKR